MKKLIIGIYIFVFWLILPLILVYSAIYISQVYKTAVDLNVFWKYVGIGVILISIIQLIKSIYHFHQVSSELPVSATPPKVLIQYGVYAIWRHPIYLFYFTLWIGIALTWGHQALLFVILPIFLMLITFYGFIEEHFLIKRHGASYNRYKKQSALILPRLPQLLKLFVKPLFKWYFNFTVINQHNIPKTSPFIVVSMHRNYLDPFFISAALPYSITYITTHEVFRKPISKWLFNKFHSIPRKRFKVDMESAKQIIKTLNTGSVLGIFPEGERSWTGNSQSFKKETLHLLNRFRHIPILPVRIEGNYHAWPRWASKFRKCPIRLTIEKPILIQDIHDLPEIEKVLTSAILPNDDQWLCNSLNLTDDIRKVLYRCPVCLMEYKLKIKSGIEFHCENCSTVYKMKQNYHIQYHLDEKIVEKTINELYEDIKLTSNHLPFKNSHGSLWIESDNQFKTCKHGLISIDENNLNFKSENSEPLYISLKDIQSVTTESNCKLQIYLRSLDQLYQLTFDRDSVLKWQDMICITLKHYHGRSVNVR